MLARLCACQIDHFLQVAAHSGSKHSQATCRRSGPASRCIDIRSECRCEWATSPGVERAIETDSQGSSEPCYRSDSAYGGSDNPCWIGFFGSFRGFAHGGQFASQKAMVGVPSSLAGRGCALDLFVATSFHKRRAILRRGLDVAHDLRHRWRCACASVSVVPPVAGALRAALPASLSGPSGSAELPK